MYLVLLNPMSEVRKGHLVQLACKFLHAQNFIGTSVTIYFGQLLAVLNKLKQTACPLLIPCQASHHVTEADSSVDWKVGALEILPSLNPTATHSLGKLVFDIPGATNILRDAPSCFTGD